MTAAHPPFPIVGVGASAGGIEALEYFFRPFPADCGLAFVIVTHLSPERVSLLHEIVAKYTPMKVEPARDGIQLLPNHVVVLPENAIIGVENGQIRLRKPAFTRRERKPVDIFLSALASDQGEYAVGVILSGGDGDGTLGIKAIRERGGLTLAQIHDGGGPRHPSMPDSAIASGMIDFALPADKMAEKIIGFAQKLPLDDILERETREGDSDLVQGIYAVLRNQVGHDFSGYKTKTFARRVQRRMQVNRIETLAAYVERLQEHPGEVAALFRDLLINVTNFFRDADAFEVLRTEVIPKLFEGRGADDTVRVWVPACSTGEEAYSLAILLSEHMDTLSALPRVQIFATDIDEHALSVARMGLYPASLLDGVSPERRRRFFTVDGGAFVVAKIVRDLCVFSPHSVIRDPPFSRMDLVSCRNLLIYLGATIQDQVIPIFHYALRPNGYLFLGMSENVSQFADLFAPVDKTSRIFRAREGGQSRIRLPILLGGSRSSLVTTIAKDRNPANVGGLRPIVESLVLERFAPPHVVVNDAGDVVFYSARTGKYLEAAAGTPSRQLLGMARKGLNLELRSALRDAMARRTQITRSNVAIETDDGRVQTIDVTVSPLAERDGDPLYLVVFIDSGRSISREEAILETNGDRDDAVVGLENEIRDSRDRLQSMAEEYETALEEMKSSNEELVSVNEEMQSANEELEASKEEIQSVNEELQTVNVELSAKIDALDQANADLRNLFQSTQVATIFLDTEGVIRNFTPPAEPLFNLLPSDRGRPLMSFSSLLAYPDFVEDIRQTLATRDLIERAVSSRDGGAHYLVRLIPYDAPAGQTRGVIVTFVDVTSLTEAESRQAELIAELNHRVKNMLAVVVGITHQTAKGAVGVASFTESLVGRLQSMARAYQLLSHANWSETPIGTLIREEMTPFGADRVKTTGPDVDLKPKQALSLGMIVHEMATNAVKYGALSVPDGWVTLDWSIVPGDGDRHVSLIWQEHNGPIVAEPMMRGLGLKLIERETAFSLRGATAVDWTPTGLTVRVDFPA